MCQELKVLIGGKIVYNNTGEGMFETYKDLWKSESKRKRMLQYGVANENIRKLMSGDDSATTSGKAKDVLLEKNNKVLKIKLGKVLEGHGPYASYGMTDVEYRIKLPKTDEILVPQTGQKVADYKITDINLEYETIEGEALSQRVREDFIIGRDLWHDYVTLFETTTWPKESTKESVKINIPFSSMKAVVMLFKRKDPTDSEEFFNAEVEYVKVTIEGNSNSVYSESLTENEVYNEATRFFGSLKDTSNDNLSEIDFLENKYALVIDFRTVDEENVVQSGRRLTGSQSGVMFEITKRATSVDLSCNVFVVADATISIADQRLVSSEH